MMIQGSEYQDERGRLCFNNDFNASQVKRIYTIENANTDFIRGWQGHKIEQRWFAAIQGSFEIKLIKVDNWQNPSRTLIAEKYLLHSAELNILHVPAGYITSIQSLEINSKLLIMADYLLGEVKDEYRYPMDYFADQIAY